MTRHTPQTEDHEPIISNRHVLRDYALTQDNLDDGVESEDLHPIYSESGGRFFYVCDIEAYVAALSVAPDDEEEEAAPRGRRKSRARNPEEDDEEIEASNAGDE